MKKNLAFVLTLTFVLMILLSGCKIPATGGSPVTAPSTAVPPTAILPTVAPPTVTPDIPSGVRVSANGIEFVIPDGLGSGASADIVPEVAPYTDGPGWNVAPAYYEFKLQGFPLPASPYFNEPTIQVFPAQEYAAVNQAAGMNLERLRAIFAAPTTSMKRDAMPVIPYFNAALAVAANMKTLNFQNGSGVRMTAHYSQAPVPVVNDLLAYHFHGLSSDGKYDVIVILPIAAPCLQQNSNTPLPAGGVEFPQDPAVYEGYASQVAECLNAAEVANTLNPSIASLDALVQSIKLNNPPLAPSVQP